MRGEKFITVVSVVMLLGSPPHARGKVKVRVDVRAAVGITPACAGKRR